MEAQSDDAGFCVSWLLGLQPRRSSWHLSRPLPPRLVRDPQSGDFHCPVSKLPELVSVSVMDTKGPGSPGRAPELEMSDQGRLLEPVPPPPDHGTVAKCPDWAKEFENKDVEFRVSYILGLIPRPQGPNEEIRQQPDKIEGEVGAGSTKDKQEETGEAVEQSEREGEEDEESGDELGLRRLYGDIPYGEPDKEDNELADELGLRKLFGDMSGEEHSDDDNSSDSSASSASSASSDSSNSEQDTDDPVLATEEFLELATNLGTYITEIEEASRDDISDTESIDGVTPEDHEEESLSKTEWLRQKTIEYASNKYLDRIMSLPGLEETKAMFLNARAKIKAATRRETPLKKENFDIVLTGNQGTGKSSVAKLYAKFLVAEKLFGTPSCGFKPIYEASWYRFSKTEIVDGVRNTSTQSNGCVVILDDAHLIDKSDFNLWNLYTRLKDLPGNIVLVIAGDVDDGLSNQLKYRAEVENQMQVLKLPNYTEEQLCVIFHRMVQKWFHQKMKFDGEVPDQFVKILIKRIRKDVCNDDFTNIWAVRKVFIEATRRQVERFRLARKDGDYPEDFFMTKEDLIGDKPELTLEKSAAWKELQELKGLDEVKEAILSIVNQASQNYEREIKGLEPLQMTPNRVFLGNPGTGKTTVAKLYGKLLAEFGVLSKGEVIVKNPGDLVDRYIGWSERNTKETLDEAKGSVLIIDDAHMLDPGKSSDSCNFRRGVLDTLVADVTGAPGEDRCVILCGYPEHMKEMYANGNPGLARRFPLDTAIVFHDFDADKLGEVLDLKLQKERLKATEKARGVAIDMLKRASMRPGFGNGAEVDNVLAKAVLARSKRVDEQVKSAPGVEVKTDDIHIEPQDFDPDWDRQARAVANTRALFEGFIGFEEIVSQFESYQYMAQGMRLRNIDPRPYIPFTYVFKGPPGTGKTTTARKLGQIFYDMGLLAAPDVIDVSASQLVGEYCGQTGPKTMRLLESALGKVLFIDEAYRLAGSHASQASFESEAVNELVDAVTKPKFARKLIIVLAGYEDDMDRLMRVNPGLRSRFATEVRFRPMRAEQCIEQLRAVVSKVGISIQATTEMDGATRATLVGSLGRMGGDKAWASGRSVETLGEKVIAHIFKQCALKGYTGAELSVTGRDLVRILAGAGVDSMDVRSWNSRPMGARQVMTLKDLEGDGW